MFSGKRECKQCIGIKIVIARIYSLASNKEQYMEKPSTQKLRKSDRFMEKVERLDNVMSIWDQSYIKKSKADIVNCQAVCKVSFGSINTVFYMS